MSVATKFNKIMRGRWWPSQPSPPSKLHVSYVLVHTMWALSLSCFLVSPRHPFEQLWPVETDKNSVHQALRANHVLNSFRYLSPPSGHGWGRISAGLRLQQLYGSFHSRWLADQPHLGEGLLVAGGCKPHLVASGQTQQAPAWRLCLRNPRGFAFVTSFFLSRSPGLSRASCLASMVVQSVAGRETTLDFPGKDQPDLP